MSTLSGWGLPPTLVGGATVVTLYKNPEQYYVNPKWVPRAGPLWYEESINRQLREIRELEDDWDGYGGARIEPNAVSRALSMLVYLTEYPRHLSPSSSGTLLLEWEGPRGKASLELGRETFGFYASPKSGNPIFLGGNVNEMDSEDINNALATIIGHHKPQALEGLNLSSGQPGIA